jgi:hypothetical protein
MTADRLAIVSPLTRRPSAVNPPSPCCRTELTGGPVIFNCPGCGRDVHGSTVDHEFRSAA